MRTTDQEPLFINAEDLERRYADLRERLDSDLTVDERHDTIIEYQAFRAMLSDMQHSGRLTWQQRRWMRKTFNDGEPFTPGCGMESTARKLAAEEREGREVKATRRRLVREHGEEGARAILNLRDRLWMVHPRVPEAQATRWAESKYARGEHLVPGDRRFD